MPTLIREILNTVEDEEGRSHVACVYGDKEENGLWHGSVVFFPADGGEPLRARHETTQPNQQDLEYWASGLTYFFLEGALRRAKRPVEPAYREVQRPGAGQAEDASHARGAVVPLSLETADGALPARLFRTQEPAPGTRRDLEGGGVLIYEGSRGEDGDDLVAHDLSLHFGSRNAAGIAANWLYSKLSGEGAALRVRGRPVEIRNDRLRDALLNAADRLG